MGLAFGAEAVTSGVEDPGVVVGALHASEQSQGLSGQLPGGQGASVGQRAEGLSLDVALLLPLLEVAQRRQLGGVLHPLDNLRKKQI